MGTWTAVAGGERHRFDGLPRLLAAASPRRSGDELAGIAAGSDAERVAARFALADLPLRAFLSETVVPYEADEVTRLILDTHDEAAFAPVSHMTVGQFRDWLLSHGADGDALAALAPGLTPEMAAASKLMRNQDLIAAARKRSVVTSFRSTLGLPGRLATRLQPNHPTDDLRGIAASTLDGLLCGSGDAVIGVNPATDSVPNCVALLDMLDALRAQYAIPSQTCVLTHVTNPIEIMRRGAPVDLVFQSVAGTEGANAGFGVNLSILREASDAALALGRAGPPRRPLPGARAAPGRRAARPTRRRRPCRRGGSCGPASSGAGSSRRGRPTLPRAGSARWFRRTPPIRLRRAAHDGGAELAWSEAGGRPQVGAAACARAEAPPHPLSLFDPSA
jgi:ethanolamine ammonia-lyase large subunit